MKSHRSFRRFLSLSLCTLAPLAASLPVRAAAPSALSSDTVPLGQTAVREGIRVEMSLAPLAAPAAGASQATLPERADVRVRVTVSDANTGSAVTGANPGAWLGRLTPRGLEPPGSEKAGTCQEKAEAFLGGSLLSRPEVDLNVYYAVTMNEGPSLSIVDPLFGFGGSKLLAMVDLPSPGFDWMLSPDSRRLYVSLPEAGQVVAVDTASWKLVGQWADLPGAGRLLMQGDAQYLWIAYGQGKEAGVAALDLAAGRIAARIALGGAPADLALTADDRYLWTADRAAGTVSRIDVHTLAKDRSVAVGKTPVSVAWSQKAETLFVANQEGSLIVIDRRGEVSRHLTVPPGLSQVRVAPDERLALAVNPEADLVHVIDVAAGRIVQTGNMEKGPDQISFSDDLAYIRHRDSEVVLMLPLAELGRTDDAPISVVDFPGGQHPPGRMKLGTPAAGIVKAPGAAAVLVANPEDQAIYYYKEGMAAPMGHFQNYGESPRAVLVVDRSLRETAPGIYETVARLPRPGEYDAVVFLNPPRRVQCFRFEVTEDPALAKPKGPASYVQPLFGNEPWTAGAPRTLRFELRDRATGQTKTGLHDVVVLATLAPGVWQNRLPARPAGDAYEIDLTPPEAGIYYLFVESAAARLSVRESGALIAEVKEAPAALMAAAP